jgi:hypothetical protein
MSTDQIETIAAGGRTLVYIVRAELCPETTTFVTPDSETLQLGFVVYPAGGEVARHVHRPLVRELTGTAEALVVREGRCELDVYDDDRRLVATRELRQGDVVLIVGGGHGIRLLEPTILLEVKQGPYNGLDEKERF